VASEQAQRDFFARQARRYDGAWCRERWPRNLGLKVKQVTDALGPALDEGPVIEVGCGTGQITAELLQAHPRLRHVGTDLSADMLAIARQRLGDRAELYETTKIPPGPYAGAFGIDVLHHVEDPARLLAHLRGELVPGAPVVFLESNPLFPTGAILGLVRKEERGLFRIRPQILARWFAGYEDVRIGPGSVYTPPGPEWLCPALDWIDQALARTPLRSLSVQVKVTARA